MVLQDALQPCHGPVNFPTVFDISREELEQLQEKHVWHMSHDKWNRCYGDASIHGVSHLSHVQAEGEDESSQMLLLLHLGNDVVQSDAFINFEWIKEVCSCSRLCRVSIDDQTFGSSSCELGSIRAETYVLDANCKFDSSLEQILRSFCSWHALIFLIGTLSPDILFEVRIKLINFMLHDSSFFDVL